MMKRLLSCLVLLATGALPAVAEPRHPVGGRPGVFTGGGFRGPEAMHGGQQLQNGTRFYHGEGLPGRAEPGRRETGVGSGPGDDDRPPPVRHRPDQDRARDAMRGGAMPLRDIQQQWRQDMPGYDFLGSDYNPGEGSYRLKFLRGGSVVWIDVDGRTGREIGRHGR